MVIELSRDFLERAEAKEPGSQASIGLERIDSLNLPVDEDDQPWCSFIIPDLMVDLVEVCLVRNH